MRGVSRARREVLVRPTRFLPPGESEVDRRREFQRLCGAVADSASRNGQIVAEVVEAVREGRNPLVLTERTSHLEALADLLRPEVDRVVTLRGGSSKKELAAAMEQLRAPPESGGRVVVATGRFVGDWRHCPSWLGDSGSRPCCRSPSMIAGAWRWIYSASRRG
jgi:hypothetical protein